MPAGSPLHASRFWYPYNPTFRHEYLEFHWDADVADGGDIVIVVWAEDGSTGEVYMFDFFDNVSRRKVARPTS